MPWIPPSQRPCSSSHVQGSLPEGGLHLSCHSSQQAVGRMSLTPLLPLPPAPGPHRPCRGCGLGLEICLSACPGSTEGGLSAGLLLLLLLLLLFWLLRCRASICIMIRNWTLVIGIINWHYSWHNWQLDFSMDTLGSLPLLHWSQWTHTDSE